MRAAGVHLAPPSGRTELLVLMLVAAASFAAVPWILGGIGLGWDALNHHVYLGWIADAPRFDRDFLAANGQAFQYPYLYWPLYKLTTLGWSGQAAGALLALLYVLAVPPLWLLLQIFVPGNDWYASAMRALGTALAFLSGVALSHLDSTANDLLAAIPLVWAVALAMLARQETRATGLTASRLLLLSGGFAGMAVAFKLSNGPLAVLLPLLWAATGRGAAQRLGSVLRGSAATLVAFALLYGYWGWQMWLHYGNPVHPFYDALSAPLRAWSGHAP